MNEKDSRAKKHVRYDFVPKHESHPLQKQPHPSTNPQLIQKRANSQFTPAKKTIPTPTANKPANLTSKQKNGTSAAPKKAYVVTQHTVKPSIPARAKGTAAIRVSGKDNIIERVRKTKASGSKSQGTEMVSAFQGPPVLPRPQEETTIVKAIQEMVIQEAAKKELAIPTVSKVSRGTGTAAEWEEKGKLRASSKKAISKKNSSRVSKKKTKKNVSILTEDTSNANASYTSKGSKVVSSLTVSKGSNMKVGKEFWLSAAEAARKLSLPWPLSPDPEVPASDGKLSSVNMGPSFVKEMRTFLKNNKDIKNNWSEIRKSGGSKGQQLEETLDAALKSIKSAYLEEKLGKNWGKTFKPSVPPKWDEVQTNWPGFDQKPVPNWEDYAIPSKVNFISVQDSSVPHNEELKNNNIKGKRGNLIRRERDSMDFDDKSMNVKKKQDKVIEHSGGGCQF